ncbi:hypothetical protein BCR44DRAFT_265734 [Catenaria anguillulae PL171]|uniref:Uncharacterized protein n=1 Tax=Catenaria anguillulae PL171 TaxID=765915 RepID=A0A1Y2H7M1_9FUNG|nr:hypothetical protein BCR44DRAFT_265734 [Catenaria anguillulae PL171]
MTPSFETVPARTPVPTAAQVPSVAAMAGTENQNPDKQIAAKDVNAKPVDTVKGDSGTKGGKGGKDGDGMAGPGQQKSGAMEDVRKEALPVDEIDDEEHATQVKIEDKVLARVKSTGEHVVIKIINRALAGIPESGKDPLEIEALRACHHPNVGPHSHGEKPLRCDVVPPGAGSEHCGHHVGPRNLVKRWLCRADGAGRCRACGSALQRVGRACFPIS